MATGEKCASGLKYIGGSHNVYYEGYQIQQTKKIKILHGIPI